MEGIGNNTDTNSGIRQGDALLTILFNVVLNGVVYAADIKKDIMKNFTRVIADGMVIIRRIEEVWKMQ